MSTAAETPKKTTWSTWEELLLAFSVKRHGLKDWDAVAMELQSRSSYPALLTAQICREKYRDLQRRFTNGDAIVDDADGGDVVIPWLEDLRRLRVAELRQEVHRHDLSIQSLQLKVKRMVEERERSADERRETVIEPDLTKEGKEDLDTGGGKDRSEEVAGEVVSGGNSDHENRSVNESNSAENTETDEKFKPDPVHGKPDPNEKPVGQEDSCKDSSNRHEAFKTGQKSNRDDVSNDVARDGGDVESSASLTKKKRRKPREAGCGGEKVAARAPAIVIKRGGADKSEPLIALLDAIRSHKHGTVFKRRLQIQKTDKYKRTIRRHMDLETVQTRLDNGHYHSCPTKFYVDLLLIFNNAIVFFPSSSPEAIAAHKLRILVMKKLNNTPSPARPKSDPDRTGPIVVCRKRRDPPGNPKRKERQHATGVRSIRKKPYATNEDDEVAMEKKKGAADFLKRIKKSSPAPPPKVVNGGAKKMDERFPAKKGVGRPRRRGREVMSDSTDEDDDDDDDDEYLKRSKKRAKK